MEIIIRLEPGEEKPCPDWTDRHYREVNQYVLGMTHPAMVGEQTLLIPNRTTHTVIGEPVIRHLCSILQEDLDRIFRSWEKQNAPDPGTDRRSQDSAGTAC